MMNATEVLVSDEVEQQVVETDRRKGSGCAF